MNKLFSFSEIDGTSEINNNKIENNILITPWTISHFIYGYLISSYGLNYFSGFCLHSLYELYFLKFNNANKDKWSDYYGFKKDSFLNTIGDTIFFMLAMFIQKKFKCKVIFIINFIIGIIFFCNYVQVYVINNRIKKLKKYIPDIKKGIIDNKIISNTNLIIWIILNIISYKINFV